jgi:hypothetical protein
LDELDYTLSQAAAIESFERGYDGPGAVPEEV